ncbi:MAG: Acetyltransferase including N-acetylase of ribosomal protein-like protein [Sphaerisporangium sp.]|jgi:RimJ/RimL family protein N-acetyltransferase|nr:Acetyltransferase including N-acetylase of ribosomal protein-like protein [Sphaerisporangium sp.]
MFPRAAIPAGPIVLREHVKTDADAITRGCADPEIVKYIPTVPVPYTLDDALAYVTELAPSDWSRGGASFAIADAATDEWLGNIGVKPLDVRGAGEIGYLLAPWARGRSVASTAARALAEWAFAQGVHRVELVANVENIASQRVAMAAGFRREGVQRGADPLRDGGHGDVVGFGRLASDSGFPQRSFLPDFPGGSLSDGVVRLAPLTSADVDPYQEMMSDPEVLVYSVPPEIPDREDTLERCRYTGTWWLAGERAEISVRDAGTGEFAGHIQLMNVTPPLGQAMVGYSLLRRFRGRGFMTRAVNLLADWAFANTPMNRLVAGTAPENTPSHRVLERAGFTREALLKSLLPGPGATRLDDLQWVRLRG